MNKNYLFCFFLFSFTMAIAQKSVNIEQTTIVVSEGIKTFNAERSNVKEDAFVVFKIKKLKSLDSENQLIEIFKKLDNKVSSLQSNINNSTLKVGYTKDITLLDIMQVLYGQGFHATFVAPDGMTGMLNSNNEIEYWYTKN